MAKDKNLHFTTYEEAAEWFDTHDMADYEEQSKPVDFHFDLRRNRHWIEIDGHNPSIACLLSIFPFVAMYYSG